MVLTLGDARVAAGWLLPMLCAGDVLAVLMWRKQAQAWRLLSLAPWVVAGIVLGAVSLSLSEKILRPVIGVIVLVMLGAYVWRRWRPDVLNEGGAAAPYGIAAGFATTVANAAGPVMSLYLLRKRLPKEEFIAAGAWFFFAVNLTKVPIYLWHGLISAESLLFDALMAPVVLAGGLTGRWLVQRISPGVFEALIVTLTAASTLLLFR